MADKKIKMLRPDSKGRITLGSLAKGVSGFAVRQDRQHYIILEPFVEIPVHEQRLQRSKPVLNQVQRATKSFVPERVKSRGSFVDYKDETD